MSKNAKPQKPNSKRSNWLRPFLIGLAVAAIAAILYLALNRSNATKMPIKSNTNQSSNAGPARQDNFDIVADYPHDPNAFLQGLLWHDGALYESTGSHNTGVSTVRHLEFPSGKVLKSVKLSPEYFGEGLALVDDRLIQITWQSKRGFVYDRETLDLKREFSYETEGWGLTYDGKNLIMSDGSNILTFLDAQTFEPVRKLPVTMNGRAMYEINELEFIEGEIWANVWHTDMILRIDPASGRVNSFLNLKGILPPQTRTDPEAVLNGIAYDAEGKRIFVSGKLWPRLFEIKVK
ncbi:MAG: glutaminyl-peptide cyclotransferase [Blastocatellia bacterium]